MTKKDYQIILQGLYKEYDSLTQTQKEGVDYAQDAIARELHSHNSLFCFGTWEVYRLKLIENWINTVTGLHGKKV